MGRQPGRFRLEFIVAPNHGLIVETDYAKIERVEPLRIERGQTRLEVGLIKCGNYVYH